MTFISITCCEHQFQCIYILSIYSNNQQNLIQQSPQENNSYQQYDYQFSFCSANHTTNHIQTLISLDSVVVKRQKVISIKYSSAQKGEPVQNVEDLFMPFGGKIMKLYEKEQSTTSNIKLFILRRCLHQINEPQLQMTQGNLNKLSDLSLSDDFKQEEPDKLISDQVKPNEKQQIKFDQVKLTQKQVKLRCKFCEQSIESYFVSSECFKETVDSMRVKIAPKKMSLVQCIYSFKKHNFFNKQTAIVMNSEGQEFNFQHSGFLLFNSVQNQPFSLFKYHYLLCVHSHGCEDISRKCCKKCLYEANALEGTNFSLFLKNYINLANVSFFYSNSEMDKKQKMYLDYLSEKKKAILVLDIDETLLNCATYNINSISKGAFSSHENMFFIEHERHITVLRPFLKYFFEQIKEKYENHIQENYQETVLVIIKSDIWKDQKSKASQKQFKTKLKNSRFIFVLKDWISCSYSFSYAFSYKHFIIDEDKINEDDIHTRMKQIKSQLKQLAIEILEKKIKLSTSDKIEEATAKRLEKETEEMISNKQ